MKLRNKKTGEIVEATDFDILSDYKSLAEFNEEWEDYEEPKEYWFLSTCGEPHRFEGEDQIYTPNRKSIGNYFNTREEAEKAVEKIKAWKQLKDNCNFRFNGVERDEIGRLIGVKVDFDKTQVTFDTAKRCHQILNLLFGGEDE